MATVTFDTQELVNKLKTAGFAQAAAEAVIQVIVDSQNQLVTKVDLAPLRWTINAVAVSNAVIVSLLIKALL